MIRASQGSENRRTPNSLGIPSGDMIEQRTASIRQQWSLPTRNRRAEAGRNQLEAILWVIRGHRQAGQ